MASTPGGGQWYRLEYLVGKRVIDGRTQYLVKWAGLPHKEKLGDPAQKYLLMQLKITKLGGIRYTG